MRPHPTPEDIDRWTTLWESGHSFGFIAKLADRNWSCIAGHIRGKRKIARTQERKNGPHNPEHISEIVRRVGGGEKQADIAAALGVSRQAVNELVRKYGTNMEVKASN